MCTAATYFSKDAYFGRNLDYDFSYGEEVVITPRKYPFHFRHAGLNDNHYSIIGMACVIDEDPLFYDAINEAGLGMAGLNFVGNAKYNKLNENDDVDNITQFEFIPWVLGQCANIEEVKRLLARINLLDEPYSDKLPIAALHWLISDNRETITVEATKDGLNIYDNTIGILTNNPPFDYQMFNLNNYINVSNKDPENHFGVPLKIYSRGMGGIGLPGDLSSQSRFIKTAFTKVNSFTYDNEMESVSQFFHILASVEQQKGCCEVRKGAYEYTIYTSCCNLDKGIYYYTTYNNHQINALDMHAENLDGNEMISYPIKDVEKFNFINK